MESSGPAICPEGSLTAWARLDRRRAPRRPLRRRGGGHFSGVADRRNSTRSRSGPAVAASRPMPPIIRPWRRSEQDPTGLARPSGVPSSASSAGMSSAAASSEAISSPAGFWAMTLLSFRVADCSALAAGFVGQLDRQELLRMILQIVQDSHELSRIHLDHHHFRPAVVAANRTEVELIQFGLAKFSFNVSRDVADGAPADPAIGALGRTARRCKASLSAPAGATTGVRWLRASMV